MLLVEKSSWDVYHIKLKKKYSICKCWGKRLKIYIFLNMFIKTLSFYFGTIYIIYRFPSSIEHNEVLIWSGNQITSCQAFTDLSADYMIPLTKMCLTFLGKNCHACSSTSYRTKKTCFKGNFSAVGNLTKTRSESPRNLHMQTCRNWQRHLTGKDTEITSLNANKRAQGRHLFYVFFELVARGSLK